MTSDLPRRDLVLSLALIGVVVSLALIGLATEGNWPKVLRVSLSFVAYAGTLLLLARIPRSGRGVGQPIPYAWFVAAGAIAGVVSGAVRPAFQVGVLIAGTIAAACLLAGVHCFALRNWRKLLPARIES